MKNQQFVNRIKGRIYNKIVELDFLNGIPIRYRVLNEGKHLWNHSSDLYESDFDEILDVNIVPLNQK